METILKIFKVIRVFALFLWILISLLGLAVASRSYSDYAGGSSEDLPLGLAVLPLTLLIAYGWIKLNKKIDKK